MPAPGRGRLRSLDGLRGVAAFGVVLSHTLLASVQEHHAYAFTPLYPLWIGGEAVIVFFVLSGFVLALPLTRARFDPAGYYPKRLIRLYAPVWAALIIAIALHATLARRPVAGASWWLNAHAVPMTVRGALRDAVGPSGAFAYDSPLWSLRWEIIFSLLLPLYVWVAVATRRITAMAAALAALGLIVSGASQATQYLPVFLLGTLLAFHQDFLRFQLSRCSPSIRALLGLVAVATITSDWWLRGAPKGVAPMLVAIGATLIVAFAFAAPAAEDALTRRPIHWLGVRSFSLYLVHEPVIVTLSFAMGGKPNPGVFLLVAIPAALIAAELFYRAIEAPSHRLSRIAGRWGEDRKR